MATGTVRGGLSGEQVNYGCELAGELRTAYYDKWLSALDICGFPAIGY